MSDIMLWVEKYRPSKLEQVIMSDDMREKFQEYIEKNEIPHLLLSGKQGTGKSTVARILVSELDAEVLALNASDERGIDTVRDKIKSFVMVETYKKCKIVFLDEADYLTSAAQAVLRHMMEAYSKLSRFVLVCNYPKMIIAPIKSRVQTFEFGGLGIKEQYKLLFNILNEENVKASEEDMMKLIDDCEGDFRRVVNEAQKMSRKGVLKYESLKDRVSIEDFWTMMKNNEWTKLRNAIEAGVDTTYMLKKLFDKVYDDVGEALAVEYVGDYFWRAGISVDRNMNLFCAFIEVGKHVR